MCIDEVDDMDVVSDGSSVPCFIIFAEDLEGGALSLEDFSDYREDVVCFWIDVVQSCVSCYIEIPERDVLYAFEFFIPI